MGGGEGMYFCVLEGDVVVFVVDEKVIFVLGVVVVVVGLFG